MKNLNLSSSSRPKETTVGGEMAQVCTFGYISFPNPLLRGAVGVC